MKQFGEFVLDTGNECLLHRNKSIALPPKPFAVLRYLVEHPGRLITHDELLDALWPETYVQPQVLRTYMLDLRKALGDDAGQPRFIQTLPKRGYRFVAPVADPSESNESSSPSRPDVSSEARPDAKPDTRPDPPGPASALLVNLVNREEEKAALRQHFASAAAGQRQVVFVTGEAGIGKTTLVDAFCEEISSASTTRPATHRTACTSRGQCVEGFGGKEEYYPVMEALRHLGSSSEGRRACTILARVAPAWLAAMGRECPDPAELAPAQPAAGERMPGDLCAALEEIAEIATETPLVLVLEDLQWADDSTLHLISALARRRGQARLFVIATCRPQPVAADHTTRHLLSSLKQDLRMRRLCTEIALAPLARTAIRELVSRKLQQEQLPPRLANFVHRRSEGNPLFATIILEHLISESYLVREEAADPSRSPSCNPVRWVQTAADEEMEASVPDGLAQMIEIELARLTEQQQRMIEAGSLMSVAFPSWAVAAALEIDPAEAEEACQELARQLYFVNRAGEDELPDGSRSTFYVFAHGLYREVLWRKQTEARRAKRHIRIADRLAELFQGREGNVAREMAVHFEAAGSWQRAIGALRAAAHHALERQAYAEGAELLERALRLTVNLREGERKAAELELGSELEKIREASKAAEECELAVSGRA